MGGISVEKLSDGQIHLSLDTAQKYVDDIKLDDASESDQKLAIINYGAYLSYVTYIGPVETMEGNVPADYYIRLKVLRTNARLYLQLVSGMKLNDDLTIDDSSFKNMCGVGVGVSYPLSGDDE